MEQPGFNPSDYNFVGGTAERETLDDRRSAGPDVFCGFGGDDAVAGLEAGDIFLGGEGNDLIFGSNFGTFYGGAGDDAVITTNEGTFNGGPGIDIVVFGEPPVDGPSGT